MVAQNGGIELALDVMRKTLSSYDKNIWGNNKENEVVLLTSSSRLLWKIITKTKVKEGVAINDQSVEVERHVVSATSSRTALLLLLRSMVEHPGANRYVTLTVRAIVMICTNLRFYVHKPW